MAALTNSLPPAPPAIIRTSASLQDATLSQPSELTGFATLSTMNRWASNAGFLIGPGAVTQGVVGFNWNKLSGFIWGNENYRLGLSEVDVGASYKVLDQKVGTGSLSLTLGSQLWAYPTAAPTPNSNKDVLATATLTWSGPVSLTADYKHLFAGFSSKSGGELLVFKVGREQPLYSFPGNGALSLEINTQAPLRYNFFIDDGLSLPCVRPGLALKWQDKAGRIGVTLDARYQIGLDGKTKDQLVYGASIRYSF